MDIRFARVEFKHPFNLKDIKNPCRTFKIPGQFQVVPLKPKSSLALICLINEYHPDVEPVLEPALDRKEVVSCWVGDDSPQATDNQRIAHFLSTIPDEKYVLKSQTFDQLREWLHARNSCVLIAACFLAADGNRLQNPLKEALETGLLSPWDYEYLWLQGLMYRNLWMLIDLNYPLIKRNLEINWDYPFNNSQELFEELVREDLEGEFGLCYRSRYEYKPSHIRRILKLKRLSHREGLTSEQNEKFWRLVDKHRPPCVWDERLTIVCDGLIERQASPLLETLWKNRGNFIDGLAKLKLQRECSRDATPHHLWDRGVKR